MVLWADGEKTWEPREHLRNVQGMVDMYTDAWFAYGHHRTVNYLTQYGVPTFQYIFAYPGKEIEIIHSICTVQPVQASSMNH